LIPANYQQSKALAIVAKDAGKGRAAISCGFRQGEPRSGEFRVNQVIGIDLGTTFSAVARMNKLGKPEIIPNREGENIMPSVVLFQQDTILVGTMAKRSAAMAPLDTVQFVKRAMGDPAWRFETTEGVSFRPEEVSALILKRLKEDAELHLGGPVNDAVITVPAYFDDGTRARSQASPCTAYSTSRHRPRSRTDSTRTARAPSWCTTSAAAPSTSR
jgi:hypothetical protein